MADRRSFTSFFTIVPPPPDTSSVMIFSAVGPTIFNLPCYFGLNGQALTTTYTGPPSTGDGVGLSIPVAGTFQHALTVQDNAAPGGGISYTLNVNSVDSALVLSVAAGNETAADDLTTVHVDAGDVVCWSFNAFTFLTTWDISIAITFTPD